MTSTKLAELVSAIHKRVREQDASYRTPDVLEDWSNDLAKLNSAYNSVYTAKGLVGHIPVVPNTPIGWVAGWVIGILQRVLSWYTLQIRSFNEASTATLGQICSLEERKFRSFLSMADRLEKLERDVRLLKSAPAGKPPADEAPRSAGEVGPPYARTRADVKQFFFELQGHFQSNVQADTTRLEMYRELIDNLAPHAPEGLWLDIGCGRGRWLRLAQEAGHKSIGVDSSAASIAECRAGGFEVAESDALEFLESTDDASFAVVSAFHILEHCNFEYCLNLVLQIARTLKPGGVFLIETPHPGNLLMAAEQFWMDPTHQRPIPLPLMGFLLHYCGLRMVHRLEVNPRPESEHLPFRELELANRLDRLLYGPQDYALVARRDE